MRELNSVPKTATKREMKVRIPKNARLARFFLGRFGRILIFGSALLAIAGMVYYAMIKYGFHLVGHWPFLTR